jgi:alkylation response protein AidB-like acyl-CoA dehydrogenase
MQPHIGKNGAERAIQQDSPLILSGEISQTAVRPGTERQQHFLALAAAHAADFQTRVAQHDRENSFPFENVAAMRASGYTTMTAPAELGGGGASVLDVVLAQERLARGDGPTAVAINMHLWAVAWLTALWRAGMDSTRPLLEEVVRDRLILACGTSDPKMHSTLGFAGINDTTRRAEKVAGGWRVNGRSGFNTLCACADILGESAHYDDPHTGPRCLLFSLPADTPGIKIQQNWDTMSIRASASHDIVWDNVFVPEERVFDRPARTWDLFIETFVPSVPSLDACYLGMAEAARDYALTWVRERQQVPFDRPMSHYPGNQLLAAEMEVGVRAARAMLVHTASLLSASAVPAPPPFMDIIACHHLVMETAVGVVDKAMRMVGGAALFRSSPLEQLYRDVRAAIVHQPFAGFEGLGILGKLAFGIPPDIMPRWV